MQAIQLTTELILLVAIASAVSMALGALTSMLLNGRTRSELTSRIEQAESALAQASSDNQKYQADIKQLNDASHKKDIAASTAQAQLDNAQITEKRLNQAVEEAKQALDKQRQQFEEARQHQHGAEKRLESTLADHRAQEEQVKELRERLSQLGDELKQERAQADQLKEALSQEGKKAKELAATLQGKEEHFKEQMQQLSETRQSLTKEFENLANKIFEEKGKTFTQTSQAGIDHMLKPFRDQIEGFQKRVNEVHDAALKGNTTLNSEIKKVLEIGIQMSAEANNLTSALKGDSQQRGAWGEAQLHRTLEMSGLVEDTHFEAQSSFKDAEGKQKQTDYLIKLPDGKHIIIDSKVSLVAYDRAIGAETPEEYKIAMSEHVKAVRKHVDDLAGKDYTNLIGMRSPGFVLMFMPIEPAYIEALKNNKDLFEYGYKKNIVLVSHTTLIPILRTVSNLWTMERSNAEAREISEKAGDIYNSVCTVAERLSKLGGTLNTVSNHYNNTVTALAGQQGLYGKVDRFSQLSVKVSKSLPNIEPAHMDFEADRLSLIVEPIEEPEEASPAYESQEAQQLVGAEAEHDTGAPLVESQLSDQGER